MTGNITSKPRFVRCPKCLNVLREPSEVPVYKCGGCDATLQAKKRNNNTVINTTSHRPDDDSSRKQKAEQVFGDHDAANIVKDASIDSPKPKLKLLSDNHEASSSLNQQSVANPMDEPHRIVHNDPRSSTELSGHEDPESSPDATCHNRIDQEQQQITKLCQNEDQDHSSREPKTDQISNNNQQVIVKHGNSSELSSPEANINNRIVQHYEDDSDQVFLSCRREAEFEDSSSEFEETFDNTRNVRVSDEDDELSESGGADLQRHRRFDNISSIETIKTERFGGYESSVSSFDGNHNQNPRKYHIGSIRDEYINRRDQFHNLNGRLGQTEQRSYYHENPRRRSVMIPENPKLERIELLKTVRELQDQLERTNISNHVLNNPGRYGHRMAFSGETTAVNTRLDGGTCHHCCPQDRHFSAQLPRPHVCCNGPRYSPDRYHTPRVSVPSSPIHHPIHNPIHSRQESEFSAPDDYRHRNDVTRPFHSPKKKRFVRPVANGSPWIACYRCSKVLELPQSFLVFNKRYHSLRCGACMKVLNFTLSNGTHVSRYYPEETIAAPPSSEVEDYIYLNGSRAGPVSCSDRSFQKSYSTETDRKSLWEFSEERRKATMSRDPSGSSQPSSSKVSGWRKMTSEIEGEHRPNVSPLHRLMGYASPSKVIRGL